MTKEQRKDYRIKNKDILKIKSKEYRAKNKSILNEKARLWRLKNKEYMKEYSKQYYKEYALNNKDKLRNIQINWRNANKDKVLNYCREYRKKNKDLLNDRQRESRHRRGINSMYQYKYRNDGFSKDIMKKIQKKKYKALKKNGGELSNKTIQIIYEDNIKKYGTLTCYLCFKPIEFGKDHLEHKTPLSRGGKNDIDNLDVSCMTCNLRKRNKTLEEYKLIKSGL